MKYFDQEIVICREDLMGRMLRNLMGVKEGVVDGAEMKKFVSPKKGGLQDCGQRKRAMC